MKNLEILQNMIAKTALHEKSRGTTKYNSQNFFTGKI